ncbi:phage tail tape measure protein [Levilactobacillus humaensis]|uniref:phage tail tape measure protein n=1 Tax=Levilactobacillus humaensis TaxID=2950375 RepID=UPI0021C48364|nr:phage tail tape measure protein [Levilactobacillus humaensis]
MSDSLSNVVLKFKTDGAVAFNKTVKDINAIMNTAAKEYRAQVAAMKDNSSAADKLAATQKKLATQLEAAGERTKILKEQYEKMAKSSDTSTAALEKQKGKIADAERAESSLRSQLDKVNGQLTEQGKAALAAKEKLSGLQNEAGDLEAKEKALTASYTRQEAELGKDATNAEKNALAKRKLTEQTALTAKQVDNLEKQLKETEAAYGTNSREANEMRAKVDEAKTSEANLKNELASTNEAIRKQGGLSTETASKMERIGTSGKKVSSVGKSLTMGLTVPLVAVGTAAVKTGGDFEAQMNRVGSISGATSGELKQLSDQAVDLGAKTVFNAKQSAEGMENLASAGFSAKEVMGAMPGVLNLAAVSGGDVGKASEYAASALRGFGLNANQSGHVANVFAEAAAKTNAEVGDMGEAMKYVAPVAKAMGISIEESAAAVGIMSDSGIKGSQAGTTLRSSMARLADPTKKMSGVMDELNLSFFDSQGKMKPLASIVGMLKERFKGLTKEQQAQAMSTLFGKESMSGMMALVNAGPDKMNKLTNSFKNSDGAAKKMADTMNKGSKASIDAMMGSLESAAIKITQVLAPAIKSVADFIGNLVDKFTNLDKGTQKMVLVFAGLAAAIGPVILTVGKLMIAIGKIPETLAAVKAGFSVLSGVMTNPWVFAIAAVVALVVAIVTHWKQIKEVTTNVWNSIKDFLSGIWKGIARVATAVWDGIKTYFQATLNLFKTIFTTAWNAIKTVTSTVFNAIKGVVTTVFEAIQVVIMTVVSVIQGIITVAWNVILGITRETWAIIKGVILTVWDGIKTPVLAAVNAIKSGVSAGWNAIKSVTSTVFNAVKSVVSTVWNAIKRTIDGVLKPIKSAVKTAWNAVKSTTSNVFKAVKSVVSSVWNSIKSVITKVLNSIKSVVKTAWNAVKSTTSSVFKAVKSVVSSVWNSIKSTITKVVNGIKNTVKSVWNSIKSVTSSVFNGIKSVTSRVWNGIKSAMTAPIKAAANTISGIINKIKGWFSGLHLRFPRFEMPPMPHFRLNGSFSLKPPSVPHIGVDWYAKGGIFTQPTIFGSSGGQLKGAGDDGPEAAIPLNAETLGGIGKGIAAAMGGGSQQPIILNIDGRTFAEISGPYMSGYLKQQDVTAGFSKGRRSF